MSYTEESLREATSLMVRRLQAAGYAPEDIATYLDHFYRVDDETAMDVTTSEEWNDPISDLDLEDVPEEQTRRLRIGKGSLEIEEFALPLSDVDTRESEAKKEEEAINAITIPFTHNDTLTINVGCPRLSAEKPSKKVRCFLRDCSLASGGTKHRCCIRASKWKESGRREA